VGASAGPDDGEYSLTQELAFAHLMGGHHARALAIAEPYVDLPSTSPNGRRLALIYAARALGDHERATDHLRHAVDSLTAHPHPCGMNDCVLALGALAALDARHATAASLLAGLSPAMMSANPLAVLLQHYQQLVQHNVSDVDWRNAATAWNEGDARRILAETTT
jgi:hypothetical protein